MTLRDSAGDPHPGVHAMLMDKFLPMRPTSADAADFLTALAAAA